MYVSASALVSPRRVAATLGLLIVSLGTTAWADTKAECLGASEKAQQLKNEGKFSQAREQLVICGRPECPAVVRQDCANWMNEVLTSSPSVVVGAKDARGKDMERVTVTVDGQVLTTSLDGKAQLVDPGPHNFQFSAAGFADVTERIVVRQGEKNRVIAVTFDKPLSGSAPVTPATAPATPAKAEPEQQPKADKPGASGMRYASYALMGVGGAALVAGGITQILFRSSLGDAEKTCKPTCGDDVIDSLSTKQTVSGALLIGGVVLAGAGVTLFFVGPKDSASAASLRLSPSMSGGAATLSGTF